MLNRNALRILALVFAVGVTACGKKGKDKNKKPPPPPPKPAVEKPAPDKPEASTMPNKLKNCPNAVEGSTTAIADAEGGVLVTVTGKDEAAGKEIQTRAAHLASVTGVNAPKVDHSGKGTGGGAGRCPIVMKDTTLEVKPVENGAAITIKPATPDLLEALKAEVESRNKAMAAGGAAAPAADKPADDKKPAPDKK